ncbi:MAG: hypothetical protein ACLFUF_01085 [Opitutales bacterium]
MQKPDKRGDKDAVERKAERVRWILYFLIGFFMILPWVVLWVSGAFRL